MLLCVAYPFLLLCKGDHGNIGDKVATFRGESRALMVWSADFFGQGCDNDVKRKIVDILGNQYLAMKLDP